MRTATLFRIYDVLAVVFLFHFFSGCASTTPAIVQTDPTVIYQMDIGLTVNNQTATGMLAVPSAASYNMKFQMPGKPTVLVIKTCGRSTVIHNAGSDNYSFTYAPNLLEQSEPCAMEVDAFAQNFNYAAAFIDFAGPSTTMPARVYCDGTSSLSTGASVCQTQVGVGLEIDFLSFMNMSSLQPGCPLPVPVKGREGLAFSLAAGRGNCVYMFGEKVGTGPGMQTGAARFHRLTVNGWQQSPLAR